MVRPRKVTDIIDQAVSTQSIESTQTKKDSDNNDIEQEIKTETEKGKKTTVRKAIVNKTKQSNEEHQNDDSDKEEGKKRKTGNTGNKKKKTGKVCNSYNINNDENDKTTFMSDDENIIMQLNVKPSQDKQDMFIYDLYDDTKSKNDIQSVHSISNHEFLYDNNVKFCQVPFEKNDTFEIFNNSFINEKIDENNEGLFVNSENQEEDCKVVKLLKDFEEKNKQNEWPMSTNVACYWCCHKFFNEPLGIPLKYSNNKFHVYGCYCSLECAQAYNFSMKDEIDEMWERSNLINLLSRKLKYNKEGFVKPAPPRLSLKMFGGHLSIEDFRNFSKKNKVVNVNFPPMVTVTQQIEEINEGDINNDYKFIPIDTDRINKYKEKMRLKRTKPVHDSKNTLDNAMNIRITSTQKTI